jgi:ribosomal protein S18 acetylase RimI-like enzyme
VKPAFGDLPRDAQELLTARLRIDFSWCDFREPRWFSAWARDDEGHIAGIFATEFKYPWEGYVTILVLDQRCMTQRTLRAIFRALFTRAVRLTAEVEPHNRRALRQVQRLGFVYEGFRRLGLEGTKDVMTYGMLKSDCKYLPGYQGPTVIAEPVLDAAVYERVH